VSNCCDVLKDEPIGRSLDYQPGEVLDERPSTIRTRRHWRRWPRATDASRAIAPPRGVVPFFGPVRSFAEGLAGCPADDDQRIASTETCQAAQIRTRALGDIGFHD
jgi:hypothetical protein